MELYKSSQSYADSDRAEHDRIPIEQIKESTFLLSDFILHNDISEENIIQYIEKLTFLVDKGAEIKALNNRNVLSYITAYYTNKLKQYYYIDKVKQNKKPLNNQLDQFLLLLKAMSKSNDAECHECAIKSQFHIILQEILKNSKEVHILDLVIQNVLKFAYEKPLTASLFDYELMITELYGKIYVNYFVLHAEDKYMIYTEEQKPYVVKNVCIPAFECVLVLLVSNPVKMQKLEAYLHRIIVSVGQILENNRSENITDIFYYELDMILYQINYIFKNTKQTISDRFTTIKIVSRVIDCLYINEEIAYKSLECLKYLTMYFSGAFAVIREEKFSTFRPNIESEKCIKRYCLVWSTAVRSLLGPNTPSKGRQQSAKLFIQKYMPDFLKYLNQVSQKSEDFEYQAILSLTFISLANYDDDTAIGLIIAAEPKIIYRISRIIEERNPEHLFVVSMALYNIISHFIKSGPSKYPDLKEDFSIYQEDIVNGINDMKSLFEPSNQNEAEMIDALIRRIEEGFAFIGNQQ